MDDILNLIASHRKENRMVLASLGARMVEQEQEVTRLLATYIVAKDSSTSTKDLLNKAKVRDLEYWYTPLSEISGYNELSKWVLDPLRNKEVHYLSDLVTKSESDLLRLSGFGRKALNELKAWLKSIGEKLDQELKEYSENQALLHHFDERISHSEDGHAGYRVLGWEIYNKLTGMNLYNIGQLCAPGAVSEAMSENELDLIGIYLRQWDENLRPGMHLPYRPK